MSTEKYFIDKDITVLCVEAESFPDGVQSAHQKLHALFEGDERKFYGISWSDGKGGIIYKSAAEELHKGEAKKFKAESFIIRKGEYISTVLKDWYKDESLVGKTFQKLLADPRIDKNGCCLEMYLNEKDMRCLVPLTPSSARVKQRIFPIFF